MPKFVNLKKKLSKKHVVVIMEFPDRVQVNMTMLKL